MSTREYLLAIFHVLKLSFSIAPSAIFFKLCSGILDAIVPLFGAYFAGQTITEITAAFNGMPGAKQRAIAFVLLTAGLGVFGLLQSTFGSYVDQVLRFKVEAKISDMLYERFTKLDFWRYDDKKTTDLYDKARDFSNFFAYVFDRVVSIFTSLFGVISAVIALSIVSPWLSYVFFATLLPNIIIQYKISRFNIAHWRENVTARRKQSFVEFNMIQPKIISELRLYNLARKMLELRVQYRNKDQGGRLKFERGFIKWRLAGDTLEAVVELGILLWAVVRIAAKTLPIGQFVYVQQLVNRAMSLSRSFVSAYGSIDEDLAKLKDYSDFMALPIAESGKPEIAQFDSIRFENVSFKYPGSDELVLKNINLEIKKGDHAAIVGENGAGKTTFVKIFLGFYEPTGGSIYVNGKPLQDYDISSWHRQIGVLLQDFTSFQFLTAKENVTFGDVDAEPTKARIDTALVAAEAKSVVESLPKKLDTPLAPWLEEDGATDLSGGQWQRLGLARNFYRQAPLLVLDEPTSAIDALAESKIFDRLFDKSNNSTIIAISHRLTTIQDADVIYVFEGGSIKQSGTHRELTKDAKGQYVRIFRRQLKSDGGQ